MSDLISRQAAIAELNEIAEMKHAILDSLNISDKRARDMIEAELGQINGDIDSIKNMPSAGPEIVRCKDCRYYKIDHPNTNGYHCCYRNHNIFPMQEDDLCSRAERRTDEQAVSE